MSDFNGTRNPGLAVLPDIIQFVNRLGSHVGLMAMRALNDRDVFDDEQILASPVGLGGQPHLCPFLAAVIATHF